LHRLPDFQLAIPVLTYQLEVGAIRSDQARSVRADGERNQDVEVEIAQASSLEGGVSPQRAQKLRGFKPAALFNSAHLSGNISNLLD
jgi:hypothetical protein